MQNISLSWDGILHRATINLGMPIADSDADNTAKPGRLALIPLPDSDLTTVQVNTAGATVRVAYSCASREAIAAAAAKASADVAAAAGTDGDVFTTLLAPGAKAGFIPWSSGDISPYTNTADFFEAPVTAVLLLLVDGAVPADASAFVHILAK